MKKALITSLDPTKYPTLHPVIAHPLAKPLIVKILETGHQLVKLY